MFSSQNDARENTQLSYPNNTKNNNSTGATTAGMTESFTQMASAAFTKENMAAAGSWSKEKAQELKSQAQDGDNSLRFIALIGGLACVLVGFVELVTRFMRLDIVGAFIDFYIILLGVVVVVLEGKSLFLSAGLVERIHKYALFLKFLWGRGCLYFIIGTLQLSQIDLLNLIVGCYMCFAGGLYIVVGKRTATKLKTLRKSLFSEQTLRTKFRQADIEGDGLNLQQFRGLCVSLGLDLTRRETEAAFQFIQSKSDKQPGGANATSLQRQNGQASKLSYEDFQSWWASTESEDVIDENAFEFV